MRIWKGIFWNGAMVAGAMLLAGIVVAIGLWIAGYPPFGVLHEWIQQSGVMGGDEWQFNLLCGVKNAIPLIFTGLAAGVAFRCGVFNIGAEGQSILGAIGATTLATRLLPGLASPWLAIPLALAAAMIGGGLWALIAASLDRWRGVPVVLSTILLNFIALQLLGMLLEGPLHVAGRDLPQSDPLGPAYAIPVLDQTSALHLGIVFALAMAALTWLIQSRTAYGFELLVTGLNPTAARLAGMPVSRRQFAVLLGSGALAGLAGGIQVMAVEGRVLTSTPVSYGYAGIAVALLGRLHPFGIVAAALFMGLLDQGASGVEISDYALPHEIADIVKGIMVLLVLVVSAAALRRQTRAAEE